jgi:hypothetical protein
MRNIYLLFAFLVFAQFSLHAQNFIPFQGIALDGAGKALVSKKIGIKISIIKDNASGTVSYAESHAPTTDNNGLFQINIGSGTALTNTFAAIDWSTLNYFLRLEMDVNGGTSYSLISTTKMGSVPFAYFSSRSQKQIIYQNVGNSADTLKIDDNVDLVETFNGQWRTAFKLPQPNQTNLQLLQRKNTTILFNCKSDFSITVSKSNTSLRDNLVLNNGEFALFLFDGEKWLNIGGKLTVTDSKENTSLGTKSLNKITTGYQNVAIGSNTLLNNLIGKSNTAVGHDALHFNLAADNTSLGQSSLYNNTNGNSNVGIGVFALYANKLGSKNSASGVRSGENIDSGTNLTTIGYESKASNPNASNEITFGDSNIKTIRSAVTSITSLSDARDKKNIQDLSLGLNFIQTLKPRSFQWDKREWYTGNTSDGSKLAKIATAGFIAQELDESQQKFNADWLNLVYKSNPEKLEANYGNLIPIIVKALQELNDENKALKIEIEKLKNK